MSASLEGISIQITFTIDPVTFHKLQKLAEREEICVSDLVRCNAPL